MNMQELTNQAIERAASDINFFIGSGWSVETAVAHVRKSSTLGPKSWEMVIAKVVK